MLFIANTVATDGYCRLSVVFKNAFPTLYKADIARQKVLQMPLACIRLGSSEKGTSSWFLIEYVEGVNYPSLLALQKHLCVVNILLFLPSTRQKLKHFWDWHNLTGSENLFDILSSKLEFLQLQHGNRLVLKR